MPNENRIYQRFKKSNYNNIETQHSMNSPTDLFMRHQVATNPLYGGNSINNIGNISHFGMNSLTKKRLSMNDIESFMRILLFIVIAVYFSILIIKSCKFNDNHSSSISNTSSGIPIPPGLPSMNTMFKPQ
jgi:hypothetical protein